MNPDFQPPVVPISGAPLGMTAAGLLNVIHLVTWGTHKIDVLLGMVKGIASAVYPTERSTDPLLSYYKQREWRLLGGLLRENRPVTVSDPAKMRERLLELDPDFFGRQLTLPRNRTATLVDECEVYERDWSGKHVMALAKRVWGPAEALRDIGSLLNGTGIEIIPMPTDTP